MSHRFKDLGVRLIACFFILWTPFFFFSSYRDDVLSATAVAASALLFALAALPVAILIGRENGVRRVAVFTVIVCLFLDLQMPWFDGAVAYIGAVGIAGLFWLIREHLAPILATAFAAVLITSALSSPADQYVDHSTVTNSLSDAAPSKASGRIVHLILDGFIGLQGIPEDVAGGQDLKQEIAKFFASHEFALQTRAISEYASTRASLSTILNFEPSVRPENLIHGKNPVILKKNAYFDRLRQSHYRIYVYQSTYMDFCAEAAVPPTSCFTFRHDGTDWLRDSSFDDIEQLKVLLGMYFNLSDVFESVVKLIVRLRGLTGDLGASLPTIMIWDGGLAPLNAAPAFETVRDTVLTAPEGTAHFAHLGLPHGPYVFDQSCNLRDHPFDWLSSHPLHEKANTSAGRERRYELYFDQIRCTLRKLESFFDDLKAQGKWANTEIILHGDHGSRIWETPPRTRNLERLTSQDLHDGFSTLFAVKSPRAGAIGEDRTTPVSQLLPRLLGGDVEISGEDDEPSVYLENQDDAPWTPVPWMRTP